MTTRTMHLCATKAWVISRIKQYGTEMLDDFEGTTEEALAEVAADPRTHFVIGTCDNQSPEGECLGHTKEEFAPNPQDERAIAAKRAEIEAKLAELRARLTDPDPDIRLYAKTIIRVYEHELANLPKTEKRKNV